MLISIKQKKSWKCLKFKVPKVDLLSKVDNINFTFGTPGTLGTLGTLAHFFSTLHPSFSPKINQARATVPAAKMVSPITLSHLRVTRAG